MKLALIVIAIIAVLFIAALPKILHYAGMHPSYTGQQVNLTGKRALIITTSHGTLNKIGETDGKATGVFGSELTHPYYSFLDAGMRVDVASVQGGKIPVDPQSFAYPIITEQDKRFQKDNELLAKVEHSIKIDDIDFTEYDIIAIAGGWGAAYDLAQSAVLAEKISTAYYSDTQPIIGGVCHGVLGLVSAKALDGEPLVKGREMTGVSDKQIKELNITLTPLHPETELRKAGALYKSASKFKDIFATRVVVDKEQRFVTGQNQNSGLEMAYTMMNLVHSKEK